MIPDDVYIQIAKNQCLQYQQTKSQLGVYS